MAPILDLTAIGLAVLVTGSLGLLAWTIGVSAVRAAARGRRQVTVSRLHLAQAERRLKTDAAHARAALADLERRLDPGHPSS